MENNIFIHLIADNCKQKDYTPKAFINAHTHGMEKYGYKNICCGFPMKEDEINCLLNMISDLILKKKINDENINFNHCLDTPWDDLMFKVRFLSTICCGEECLQAVVLESGFYEGIEINIHEQLYREDLIPLPYKKLSVKL